MKKDTKPYMGTVRVGPKGQIVIPKEIRDMFGIEPGDSLIIMAHPKKGIAIERQNVLLGIAEAIFAGRGKEVYPYEEQSNLDEFAKAIKEKAESGEDDR
ncbi:MAG: AbrB/MazE/SpoVT family DNA-binding domain-containing protein [Oscillospiraceae bacterium]|nr:AbrB/MazE/SpoVT family DNA-binding domain-containing protein [Oscillospiraceae bacterium]